MKNFLSSLLLLTGLVAATACSKKGDATPVPMTVTGTLNGSQEAPTPTNSSATGTVSGTYDKASMVLTYTITFSGITPTAGHFHIGAPGVSNPPSLSFPYNNTTKDGFVSPITATATLTAEQATALLGNAFYANLHSKTYLNGEIRANLTTK